MKALKTLLIVAIIHAGVFTSCIESEYHWDNMNTEGILNIPPVPLGSFEKISFGELAYDEGILDPEITDKLIIQYKYVLHDILGSDVMKDFFYEGMKRDVSIEGDFNLLFDESQNPDLWKISLAFSVLDGQEEIVPVNITGIEGITSGVKKITIALPKELYNTDAQHLMIAIKFKVPSQINLEEGNYLQLSNLIIKTAGYVVDL